MRQTDLTIDQLSAGLFGNDNGGECRRCLFINELGELLAAGEAKAGPELAKCLSDSDDCVRAPAFIWLARCAPKEFGDQLTAFVADQQNAAIVAWAKDDHGISYP
jgi:hypothetical protein